MAQIQEIKVGDKTLRVTCFDKDELERLKAIRIAMPPQKKPSLWARFNRWIALLI